MSAPRNQHFPTAPKKQLSVPLKVPRSTIDVNPCEFLVPRPPCHHALTPVSISLSLSLLWHSHLCVRPPCGNIGANGVLIFLCWQWDLSPVISSTQWCVFVRARVCVFMCSCAWCVSHSQLIVGVCHLCQTSWMLSDEQKSFCRLYKVCIRLMRCPCCVCFPSHFFVCVYHRFALATQVLTTATSVPSLGAVTDGSNPAENQAWAMRKSLSACLSLFVCLSLCLCMCVHVCIYLSIYLSVCLSVCLSVGCPRCLHLHKNACRRESPLSVHQCQFHQVTTTCLGAVVVHYAYACAKPVFDVCRSASGTGYVIRGEFRITNYQVCARWGGPCKWMSVNRRAHRQ